MKLKYANEQARQLLNKCAAYRATAWQQTDLRIEIVKLGARLREQDSILWEDQFSRLLGTQKTVRTTQGSFRLRAFGMPDHPCGSPQQIMIVIEDHQATSSARSRRGGTDAA